VCIISIEIASEYSYVEARVYCHVDTVTRKNKETLHKKQIFNWQKKSLMDIYVLYKLVNIGQ